MESCCCGEETVDDSLTLLGVKMSFLAVAGCCIFDIVVIGLKLLSFDLQSIRGDETLFCISIGGLEQTTVMGETFLKP